MLAGRSDMQNTPFCMQNTPMLQAAHIGEPRDQAKGGAKFGGQIARAEMKQSNSGQRTSVILIPAKRRGIQNTGMRFSHAMVSGSGTRRKHAAHR